MNGRALMSVAAGALVALLSPVGTLAQVTARPTPDPYVTADRSDWYLAGEPITFAGNIYYPAGAQVFFNRYEMVRSGFYEGIPLYTRTTFEPFSTVFVPVGGGLMQPYERRRAGDVAGTTGSRTPSFPVVTPAEEGPDQVAALLLQAPAPPTRTAISVGNTSRELTGTVPGSPLVAAPPSPTVATAGRDASAAPPAAPVGPLRSAVPPQGINRVFISYDNRRWFSSGPAVEFSPSRFTQVGEYRGFPVYAESANEGRIYVASTAAAAARLAPYSSRR